MSSVRISIVGTSGSGKSTLGKAIAAKLRVPFVELDSIRHQANWVELPDEEFRARVREIVARDSWVLDGNYGVIRDIAWPRATQIVWIDLPRWRVMQQVIWRSLSRVIKQEELWNGNRERWSSLLDAEHPIRWAYSTHARRQQTFSAAMDARWVRLRSREESARWLASLKSE